MAAWSSICWVNDLWAAVSAALVPAARRRRNPNPSPLMGGGGPQPAGGPNPRRPGWAASCRLARALGRGPGPLAPPERRPGPAQREPRAGPRQGPPTPPPGRWGPAGEVGLGAGGARTQARPPTPRQGGHSQRPGHRPTAERPGGGLRPPHTGGQQRDRTQADHGPGARRQPPAHTNGGEGPTGRGGQGRAAAMGRGGRAGPVPAGLHPTGRIPLSQPATFGGGPRGPGRPHTDKV